MTQKTKKGKSTKKPIEKETESSFPKIYCHFTRDEIPVFMDAERKKSTMKDMGRYRIAVKYGQYSGVFYIGDNKIDPNKKNQVMDVTWYARLKAVECFLDWEKDFNIKEFIICDEHPAYYSSARSKAQQFKYLSEKSIAESGARYTLQRIHAKDNIAKQANVPNAPQYFTPKARMSLAAKEARDELSDFPNPVSGEYMDKNRSPQGLVGALAKLLLSQNFLGATISFLEKEPIFSENKDVLITHLKKALEEMKKRPSKQTSGKKVSNKTAVIDKDFEPPF